ncbi:HK97 family phage prohead protease [Bacteroides caecimuris]|uniref:HK97 family phage prohead protease n=1 Tax=Bacteroides caecimuris TaxID=1796613 RepID=UPI002570CC77|nr:HK97 family phage prohead protease [Bacteroides caecimuris]
MEFKKPSLNSMVSRSFAEYGVDDNGNITGVPIVFEQSTDIGGLFEETIARGAISEDVLRDVAFFYNHDLNSKPLARTKTGRLKLTIENDCVRMSAETNRERTDVNDLYLAIQDGDIDGMSFLFRVDVDEWTDLDTNYPKRRITKIGYVQEVSAVNYPAYEGTSINARSEMSDDQQALINARARYEKSNQNDDLELEKLKAKYLFNI